MPVRYTRAGFMPFATSLPVKDLDAALPFFQIVLGFQIVSRDEATPRSAALGRDDVEIVLAEKGGYPEDEGCAFEVGDAQAAWSEMKAAGLEQGDPDFRVKRYTRCTYTSFPMRGPEGLRLSFWERRETSEE